MTNVETKLQGYLSADWIKKNQQDNSHVFSGLTLIGSHSLTHAQSQYDYQSHTASRTPHPLVTANDSGETTALGTHSHFDQPVQSNSQNPFQPNQLVQPESATESTSALTTGFNFHTESGAAYANVANNSNVSSLLESLFSQSAPLEEINFHIDAKISHLHEASPNGQSSEIFVQSQNFHSTQASSVHALHTSNTSIEDSNWSNASGWGQAHIDKALGLITGKTISATAGDHSNPLDVMGFNTAWNYGYTGKGVVIAHIDTGIDLSNAQLVSNLHISEKSWNFINQTSDVQDDNGHGTVTAEELAAGPNFDDLIDGGAYDAQIMVLKALDAYGRGSDASVSKAIEYAVDNGADIINLSLGQYTPDASLFSAIRYADAHGVIVVAAAGNSGSNAPNFPAAYAEFLPNVIAVGATQISQNSISMSEFSNHAGANQPYNFVNALGVDILGIGLNGQEGYWSGTSMATPYISAEAAILKQANPNASATEIVQAITHTAEKIQLSVAGLHIDLSSSASTQSNAQSTTQSFSNYHLETSSTHYSQYVPSEQYY